MTVPDLADTLPPKTEHPSPPFTLAIDIGGTHVKILLSGLPAEPNQERKVDSNPKMTPGQMVKAVQSLAKGWQYAFLKSHTFAQR